MRSLGLQVFDARDDERVGSTDMGNVMQVAAGIHPYIAISDLTIPATPHPRSRDHAATPEALRSRALVASKALALTAIDVLGDPELLKSARAEFDERRARAREGASIALGREARILFRRSGALGRRLRALRDALTALPAGPRRDRHRHRPGLRRGNVIAAMTFVPIGLAADRWGGKRLMVGTWVVSTIGAAAFLPLSDWRGAFVGSVLYWVGSCGLSAAVRSSRIEHPAPPAGDRARIVYGAFFFGTILASPFAGAVASAFGLRGGIAVGCVAS
jgi:hypothetical protein